jgi:hypothetical protein
MLAEKVAPTWSSRCTVSSLPSFDVLEPLAPVACRCDPSAPCAYWHTELHALIGGRDKLSQRELTTSYPDRSFTKWMCANPRG